MTKERKALKLALEALESNHGEIVHDWALVEKNNQAITAIKEALEQPDFEKIADDLQNICDKQALKLGHLEALLAQPEQKYRRGNRLICLETEEFCVIHISGTDRQWVKFPDSHIGFYTNEQVAELFELLPKEPEQEPVAWTLLLVGEHHGIIGKAGDAFASAPEHYRRVDVYTTPPQRKPLTSAEIRKWWASENGFEDCKMGKLDDFEQVIRAVEGKHGIKEST